MQGDFTRSTFDPKKRYTSVRLQQGRVQLDADWNEQVDIQLHNDRSVAADVIGPCGAPEGNAGFGVVASNAGFAITPGHLYVDGILCENETMPAGSNLDLLAQPDFPGFAGLINQGNGIYLLYADVWERHMTAVDDANIRDVALGGPDTATRTRVIWQVKAAKLNLGAIDLNALMSLLLQRDTLIALLAAATDCANKDALRGQLDAVLAAIAALVGSCASNSPEWNAITAKPTGRMKAYSAPAGVSSTPCIVPPGGGYRRLENQLYRVEIHHGTDAGTPTFKWSRENASLIFPVSTVAGNVVHLARLGRDRVLDISSNDWVEILDDDDVLMGRPGELYKVLLVKHDTLEVTIDLNGGPAPTVDPAKHAIVRRWDQRKLATRDGLALQTNVELELEDGVKVFFEPGGTFRSGDYWLIPARAALDDMKGDVIWPREAGVPAFQLPAGIKHHYCKLGRVLTMAQLLNGIPIAHNEVIDDCRTIFPPLTKRTGFFYVGGDGQETMPGGTLPQPLQVGFLNNNSPRAGVKVRFEILDGGGSIMPMVSGTGTSDACSLTVETNAEGIAAVHWAPDATLSKRSQRVRASVADEPGKYLPVYFSANLSIASQVAYVPGECARLNGATTVQEALDMLCQSTGGICTYVVTPGTGWESVFDQIPDGFDAQICFPVGVFQVTKKIVVANKGRLSLTGAGGGTRIISSGIDMPAESALTFRNCTCVEISEMYFEGSPIRFPNKEDKRGEHLSGVLNFIDCTEVDISRVSVKCGPELERAMTCITVAPSIKDRNRPDSTDHKRHPGFRGVPTEMISMTQGFSTDSVRIRHCNFEVGYQQIGILLIDVERAQVEDNILRVGDFPIIYNLQNERYRQKFVKMFVALARQSQSGQVLSSNPRLGLAKDVPAAAAEAAAAETKAAARKTVTKDAAIGKKAATTKIADNEGARLASDAGVTPSAPASSTPAPASGGGVAGATGLPSGTKITGTIGINPAAGIDRTILLGNIIIKRDSPLTQKIVGLIPADVKGTRERKRALTQSVDKLFTDPQYRAQVAPELDEAIIVIQETPISFASQGIVVAGKRAREVRILNNSLTGFLQGIHAGFSYRKSEYRRYTAGTLRISGNRIESIFPMYVERERNGIFVGNCDSLIVENNYLELRDLHQLRRGHKITGIRVHGIIGRMMLVIQNHIVDYYFGVVIKPLYDPNSTEVRTNQWLLRDNMIAGPATTSGAIRVDWKVLQQNNVVTL